MPVALLRVFLDALLVAAVLFSAAGTLAWPRAWVLVLLLWLVRSASVLAVHRVNPALVRERAALLVHRDQPLADKLLFLTFMFTAFIALPAIAALDSTRWHLLPAPPMPLSALGLGFFVLGWFIIALALRENAFATTVVRLQQDRAQKVVDSGVYGIVRHPIYAANPLVLIGIGLWLGSYPAALFAFVPFTLLALRMRIEEQLLTRELPGYREYETRVRHRVIPGLW